MEMVMRSLKRTTMAMKRMTTTGHVQAAIRTVMAMDPGIIIIMGIRHSVMMSNSTTTTITTSGDNEQKIFDFFIAIDPSSALPKNKKQYPILCISASVP